MKLLVPVVLAVAGVGAGVGAGVFLRPGVDAVAPEASAAEAQAPSGGKSEANAPHGAKAGGTAAAAAGGTVHGGGGSAEYVQLRNQFIVPVLHGSRVTSLVVLSIDLEVAPAQSQAVHRYEPKIRDAFLTVLFDHANTGGFEGNFTSNKAMDMLRGALREAGQKAVGNQILTDVLITNIIRQDV